MRVFRAASTRSGHRSVRTRFFVRVTPLRPRASTAAMGRPRSCARRAPVSVHRLAVGVRVGGRRCVARRVTLARQRGAPHDAGGRRPADGGSPRAPGRRRASPTDGTAAPTPGARYRSHRGRPDTVRRRGDVVGGRRVAARGARALAGKVQGRRTTVDARAAARVAAHRRPAVCASPRRGSSRRTWSPTRRGARPGGDSASPLANGGAFGGKVDSPVGAARAPRWPTARPRRSRASSLARTSCASAPSGPRSRRRRRCDQQHGARSRHSRRRRPHAFTAPIAWPYALEEDGDWTSAHRRRYRRRRRPLRASRTRRARGAARRRAARRRRPTASRLVRDDAWSASVLLDSCVAADERQRSPAPAWRSGSRGPVERRARVRGRGRRPARRRSCSAPTRSARRTWRSAGCSPRASPSIPDTGEVHDLTIRSFGILRAEDTPPIDVELVDDPGAASRTRASDAVFAAVAAAAWNAVSDAEGARPGVVPRRRSTRVRARALRRWRRRALGHDRCPGSISTLTDQRPEREAHERRRMTEAEEHVARRARRSRGARRQEPRAAISAPNHPSDTAGDTPTAGSPPANAPDEHRHAHGNPNCDAQVRRRAGRRTCGYRPAPPAPRGARRIAMTLDDDAARRRQSRRRATTAPPVTATTVEASGSPPSARRSSPTPRRGTEERDQAARRCSRPSGSGRSCRR